MDPIHPILPQKVNIPPVAESPRIGRIDRRDPRRDRENRPDQPKQQDAAGRGFDSADDAEASGEDKTGPHIDITA